MRQTDKVSCVLASWNFGMLVRDALESLVNQTIVPHKIIIADDNSTDSSREIFEEYIAKYPDLFVKSYNDIRLGTIANENKAAQLVETPWMFFMDSDDTLDLSYVEKCLSVVEEKDNKLAIVYSDMLKIGNWSGEWRVNEWDEEALWQANYINGHSVFRTDLFKEVGGLKENAGFEDHKLWVDFISLRRGYYGS